MRKIFTIIFIISLFTYGYAEKRSKIGVALAGGGALGFAHIGALEVIDSLGIPIDYVSGTSMGGLVGAFVAMGYSPKEIEKIVLNEIRWTDIFNDSPSRYELPFIEKETTSKEQLVLKLSNNYIPQLPDGFLEGQNIYLTLLKYTTPFEALQDFSKLPVPLRVVAVDLVSGEEIVLDKGSLAFAMRSTMSIPTVFSPTEKGDMLLIDGGVINNFPVDVVKKMGADIVIGLNLTAPLKKKTELNDLMSILNRTTDIPRFNVLNKNINLSDIYIPENIDGYTPGDFEYKKIKELIARGKKAAYAHIDELIKIRNKLRDEAKDKRKVIAEVEGAKFFTPSQVKKMVGVRKGVSFDLTEAQKRAEFYSLNPFIKSLSVSEKANKDSVTVNIKIAEEPHPLVIDFDIFLEGRQKNIDDKMFTGVFKSIKNKPFDYKTILDKIEYLYSFGYFKNIRYEIYNEGDNKIRLIINVATDYMKEIFFSLHYDDYYQLVGLAGLKVNSTLIPGLRWDVLGAFSGVVALKSKLSFPSRSLDEIFYPFWEFRLLDRSLDIFGMDANVSYGEYDSRSLYNKIGLGITPSRFTNLEMGYNIEWVNIHPSKGFVGVSDENYHLNDYFATLKIDALDNFNFPKNGFYLHGNVMYSSRKLGSNYDYLIFTLFATAYKTFGAHTFRLGGAYFQAFSDTDEPYPRVAKVFGGPTSFIGWSYSAAMFTKLISLRAEYHYNFWSKMYLDFYVNTAFNYNLYFYYDEIGQPTKVFWGGGLGVTYDTPLGPASIIWSLGDNSVVYPQDYIKRVYFTFGVKIGDLLEF